jgi:hypothetical protein
MLYRGIMAVCSEIHTKHINTVCGQNVKFVDVKLVVNIVTTMLQRVKPALLLRQSLLVVSGVPRSDPLSTHVLALRVIDLPLDADRRKSLAVIAAILQSQHSQQPSCRRSYNTTLTLRTTALSEKLTFRQ